MPRARLAFVLLLAGAAGCAKGEAEWIADLAAPEPFARVLAVTALAQAGRPETLPLLLAALDDGDEEVRAAAGAALARWGAPAVPPLLEALRPGAFPADRDRALATLPLLSEHAAVPLVEALLDGQHETEAVLGALEQLDAPAAARLAPQLVAALQSGGTAQRKVAAEALHALAPGDRETLLALLHAARDDDPAVRTVALKAVVGALLLRMRTPDGLARHAAQVQINALGPEALPALARALREAPPAEAGEPVAALATYGPEALAPAFELLNQRDPQHVARARALVEAIGPDALQTLHALVDTGDARQQLLALVTLGSLRAAARPAVPRLLQALAGDDSLQRWAAAHALGLIGPADDAQLARLLDAAADADGILRQQLAPGLVEALLERIATRPAEADAWRARLTALGGEANLELKRVADEGGPRAELARELVVD